MGQRAARPKVPSLGEAHNGRISFQGPNSAADSLARAAFVRNARPRSFNRRTVSRCMTPDQRLDCNGLRLGGSSSPVREPHIFEEYGRVLVILTADIVCAPLR